MLNRTDILNELKNYKSLRGEQYGILSLGIFGSCSRNMNVEGSDVDIVVSTKTPDLFQIVHIKEELESIFNAKVDIVRKRENMNQFLAEQIKADAIYV